MRIRPATADDAKAMSALLQKLVVAGTRTARADIEFVLQRYVHSPVGVRCSLAEDNDGNTLGFQSLIRATEGNPYDTPIGWGIIGTHVSPDAARQGIGRCLFNATRQAASEAGLTRIEAFITSSNLAAQAFYESIGFRTYRTTDIAVCKCWTQDIV